jgi:hypothetical protein
MIFPIRAAFAAKQARAKVFRALKPGYRDHTDVQPGQYVRFFREKKGWSTPCLVVSVKNNMITVLHSNTHKTAGRTSVVPCDPPFTVLLNPDQCTLDFDEEGYHSLDENVLNTGRTTTTITTEDQDVEENMSKNPLIDVGESISEPANENASSMIGSATEPVSSKSSSKASSSAMVLRSASNAQSETNGSLELDQSQAVTFVSTHFFSSMPFTSSSKLAN